ncbi:hypothetical protein [Caballeronia sp. AZ7_KS35]|nr:hypothetical protein [Caballeronia sp. AZ7_KS35]
MALERARAGGGAMLDIGLYCLNAARFLNALGSVLRREAPSS